MKNPILKNCHTRCLLTLLTARLVLALSACGMLPGTEGKSAGKSGNVYRVYYINKADTTICPVEYRTDTTDAQLLSDELIEQLCAPTNEVGYFTPVNGFTVMEDRLQEEVLTLDLSDGYFTLEPTHEILVRAAIVSTLCQIDGVEEVCFLVGGEELLGPDKEPIGPMNEKRFIFNSGNELEDYERIRLHLYFASESGDRLVDTYRTIVYNSNVSIERVVTEAVLKGPISSGVYPTLNADTKLLSVTTRDGVCYVNVDNSFLIQPYRVTPQVALYSLVNSLTELPSVNKVQISVDGQVGREFMEAMDLSAVYSRNDALTAGDDH